MGALSSVGRAPDLHSGGQEFDSPSVHQIYSPEKFLTPDYFSSISPFVPDLMLPPGQSQRLSNLVCESTFFVESILPVGSILVIDQARLGKFVPSV